MGIVAPINRLRGHRGVTVNLPTGLDVRHRHPVVSEAQVSPEEAPDLAHGGDRGSLARVTHPEILQALRRARDLTDRDFAQPLTLDAMAAAARLSKFHFARAFARAYGETPRTYLT